MSDPNGGCRVSREALRPMAHRLNTSARVIGEVYPRFYPWVNHLDKVCPIVKSFSVSQLPRGTPMFVPGPVSGLPSMAGIAFVRTRYFATINAMVSTCPRCQVPLPQAAAPRCPSCGAVLGSAGSLGDTGWESWCRLSFRSFYTPL